MSFGGPYQNPGYGAGGYGYGGGPYGGNAPPPGTPAAVWPWYVAYAVFMALMYLACVVGGGAMFVYADDIRAGAPPDEDPVVMGVVLMLIGLPLMLAYAAAPFLPKKPWAWTFHIVLICIGLSSACCAIASIPLLIGWLKPECKAMFGKT